MLRFNLKMNTTWLKDLSAIKIYSEQLNEGDSYSNLSRTVCINILNFKYLPIDKFHSCYKLKETTTHEELTDTQKIHFIEILKLPKNADIIGLLVAWVEFLKDPERKPWTIFRRD